jgi:hypothetical protein
MGWKYCPGCGTTKDIKEFNYKDKKRGKRQIRCRSCTRLQVQNHYQANHAYYIKKALKRNAEVKQLQRMKLLEYLAQHPCVDCGESDAVCLQFDHVRGKKVQHISKMIGTYEWSSIEKELTKCQVRCANCHQRRTAERRGYYRVSMCCTRP